MVNWAQIRNNHLETMLFNKLVLKNDKVMVFMLKYVVLFSKYDIMGTIYRFVAISLQIRYILNYGTRTLYNKYSFVSNKMYIIKMLKN